MRGENNREGGAGVIFRNIRIEDPRPTLQQFFLCTTVPPPYSKSGERGEGDVSDIVFENISIAAPSILGEPQLLWGHGRARIRNIRFENLVMGGKPVTAPAFFKTNEFVEGLIFGPK
jgi:hypothetical protein